MKRLLKIVIGIALVCPAFSVIISCSTEADCSMNARPMTNCILYTLDRDGYVVNDTLDSLTVTALGTDSIIINNQKRVHDVILPLRYTSDSTILVFHYSPYTRDTLTIRHTNTPYFLSMDCGYQMQQRINTVSITHHRLDSIHINNYETGIYGQENIQIFY